MGWFAAWMVVVVALIVWVVSMASDEQDGYDDCWAAGGVQVKTVKFSNGTVCIDRRYVIEP